MRKLYQIENLDCPLCASKMEKAVSKLPGVSSVSISFTSQKMMIESELNPDDLLPEIQKAIQSVEPECEVIS